MDMNGKKSLAIGVIVIGIIINTLFGLYNLKVTKRVKCLTKTQSFFVLLLNILNTGVGVIHLIVNLIIGAYKKK